ncbi:MAG TPA: Stp1/IreP family PP2C-type Ser/Thr phosphatase [Gemmatimonadaceae bacterium]|nr:Stp1/IreP family PP2C-type Ser/Thr phosphatase [Gemmatimonadaceae bacterium]
MSRFRSSAEMPPPAAHPQDAVRVRVFGRTDVGRTREHNEDAFVVADLSADNATLQPEVREHAVGPKGTLFMVADGMGGAAAGEIASAMAVEVVLGELRSEWITAAETSAEAFARALRRATAAANEQINSFATQHPEYRGMGTTATIAGLLGHTLYLAQVGDSRAYLVRGGVARQITKDQSLMQKLIEAGELTEEEAAQSERRNIILQALGPEATIKVDLTHQAIRRGDTLVLCSDGLSGQVTKDEIGRVVSEAPDLVEVCKRLIDLANAAGGPDNITVIAARFEGPGLRAPETGDAVGHCEFPLPETGQTPARSIDGASADGAGESDGRGAASELLDLPAEGPRDDTPTPVAPVAAQQAREISPAVSPVRRKTGMLIAIVLLAVLVLGAAWLVWHTARKVTPARTTPPATTPGPAATSSSRPAAIAPTRSA